ncbi:hypothetical protein HPG69_005347 [Diceros bicornis minor]|uniref:Uncharacterized protein n=1 Tax=Diceros bicornis minor TaxID=77932 RepID=A0A7J7EL94_DICBM|nr:hypothetical protein HPG69_005347 [Diceros bicornis minor]
MEVGAEEKGSQWRQERVGDWGCGSPEAEELLQEWRGPRAICGSSSKPARAAGVSSTLLFASLSLGTAATAISSSIGVVALILLLVGLLSMTLKKWRHERLFKKQLRHQTNFLHKSSELSCPTDAIYSNVINLAHWKEDDFAVYANVLPFDRPRRTSPDQVEYASVVFH